MERGSCAEVFRSWPLLDCTASSATITVSVSEAITAHDAFADKQLSQSLYLDLSWQVHHHLCGSDHFPIAIYCNRASTFETNCSWKLSKTNWKAFYDKAASDLNMNLYENQMIRWISLEILQTSS